MAHNALDDSLYEFHLRPLYVNNTLLFLQKTTELFRQYIPVEIELR
jgi:hypothetical protein